MLREVGGRQGRRIGLAIRVLSSPANCRLYGLDVASWLKQIDMDYLICHPTWSPLRIGGSHVCPQDVAEFARMTHGTSCCLCPDVYPRQMPAAEFRRKASDYYAAGADGLSFWDTETRFDVHTQWNTVAALGHKGSLENDLCAQRAWFRRIPLATFNGFSTDPAYSLGSSG